MTLANHANAPGWLVLMNISSRPQGGGERGRGRLLPEHVQSTWEGNSDKI